ncbi:MAG: NADH:flavin oxidoreductase [Alphaproteobacteria bacterium]|jgi:2,4-dienoyl-CoA reductase-like NADH-dependent reductase (Old Yellow Enzyme family)|nr:NADH:flavin oxidoreductase [Alphaproteobacteria bacterium]
MSDLLFEPCSFGPLTIPNRLVMAPMTRYMSPGGVPSDDVAAYYRRRVEGGTGLIITEGTTIDQDAASPNADIPRFHGDDALAGWQHVVDEVHAAGGVIMPQLWHQGTMRKPGSGAHPEAPSIGPSGLLLPGKERGIAMTQADIDHCVEAFAKAAGEAKRIGFDGVELHGAHGYLLDQFFWEGTNQRDDAYGGDLVKRTRFAAEITAAVRDRVGPDYPILLRFSQWKQQDFPAKLAQNPAELEAFLAPLIEAGVDIFHCSTRRFWLPEFEGSDLNLAGWTRQISGKPTITVGSIGLDDDFINTFSQGEAKVTKIDELLARLEREEFDLVAVGRILITNPAWPHLVREGRYDEILPYTKDALATLH